jgi:hypothetical protein
MMTGVEAAELAQFGRFAVSLGYRQAIGCPFSRPLKNSEKC